MPNRITLNKEECIEQVYDGDQTSAILHETVETTTRIAEDLNRRKLPVRILADVSAIGKIETPTRKAAVDTLKTVDYYRVAIFGANTFTKALVGLIIHAAGKSNQVKLFKDRASARAWLANADEAASQEKDT